MIGQTTTLNPRIDRRFYTLMSLAIAITVFAGFAPSFYLKGVFHGGPLTPLAMAHGFLFTTWIILYVSQTALISKARISLHRRLGMASAGIVAAMVVVGALTAIAMVRRQFGQSHDPARLSFLAISTGELLLFALLIGSGFCVRRNTEAHKRLMLLGTISLLAPAIARLPLPIPSQAALYGATDLFLVACLIYDFVTRRRIHQAFAWGGAGMVFSQMAWISISGTKTWITVARWIIS